MLQCFKGIFDRLLLSKMSLSYYSSSTGTLPDKASSRKVALYSLLVFSISCSTPSKEIFLKVRSTNTKEAYRDFISKYPHSPEVPRAKLELEKLEGTPLPSSSYKWSSETGLDIQKQANGRYTDLKGGMKAALDFYRSKVKRHTFTGVDNVRIAYDEIPVEGATGALIISHGTGENPLRYAETVFDLVNNKIPYSIFLISHRGMGFSQRLLGKNRDWNPSWDVYKDKEKDISEYKKIHSNDFEDYVKDFSQFVKLIREKHNFTTIHAIGHSLGGGIVTRYAELNPGSLQKIVLSAPLHSIIGVMGADNSDFISKSIISVSDTFSHTNFAIGGGGAGFSHFDTKFEENNIINPGTMSYQRFMMKKLVLQEFPETSLGGLTWGFVDSLYEGVKDIRSDADKIKAKTLILQAEHDEYVHPSGQRTVCDRINKKSPGLCKLEIFLNAKHELFLERDMIRLKVLNLVYEFLVK